MNKKFLSAILFGALMVTSTGTFVSCKDYDDDIKGLQTQIDANKNAIAELQKLVGSGNWVTNVAASGSDLVVTMSNGSTVTVAGVKGADGQDGKDATEWTIGEDGYWYMDGEKTENLAVAQNGKDGVTAPSPKIENGLWVVYNWDAEKGEFVAETTNIPAAGTSAYAVKADGIWTLHIADANGEYQDIALPATSDAFVATSPVAIVNVLHQEAKWTVVSGKDNKALFAKLAEAFPEIEEYEKDDLMKQGGNLPVIISPANVELTNEFKYSLQSVKGEVSKAVVSNPVKGMPETEMDVNGLSMITRSADSNDCLWTLNVEPAKNKKGTGYVDVDEAHTLVIENAKGTVVKTAFAYYVTSDQVDAVEITYNAESATVPFEDEIDVLAKAYDLDDVAGKEAIFTIEDGMNGKYILEVDKLDAERYEITVDGSKLSIGNMPSDKNSLTIKVNLIALGLNGSVAQSEMKDLTIGQEIAATGTLEHDPVVLNGEKAKNKVRYAIEDLGFTAVQLNEFMTATTKKLEVSYIDEDDKKVVVENTEISVYKANGTSPATSYEDAAIFGINLDPKKYAPRDYDVRLEVVKSGSTIYVAEGTLTVENPTTTAIKLAAAFVDENGVLQVTGTPGKTNVTYDLTQAFVYKASEVEITSFEDLEAEDDDNWIIGSNKNILRVDLWSYDDTDKQDLYKVRNFKVYYELFDNPENKCEMEFQAQVLSEIYAEDPSEVITLTEARLTTAFGAKDDKDTKEVNESLIDFTQITKAVYAAGLNAGKEYNLWAAAATEDKTVSVDVKDYNSPKVSGNYVVTSAGIPVEIAREDLGKFGMDADEYLNLEDTDKFYIVAKTAEDQTLASWQDIMVVVENYYSYENAVWTRNEVEATEEDALFVELFEAYASKIAFNTKSENKTTEGSDAVLAADGKVTSVVINFVDEEEGKKYATISNNKLTAVSKAPLDVVGGQVIVPMYIEITDAWGMIMKHEFNVTIKTVQE